MPTRALLLLFASCALSSARDGAIRHDAAHRTIEMSDESGKLKIRLNYADRCLLDRVEVNGREVVAAETGVCTAIQVAGNWATTRGNIPSPKVTVKGDEVSVHGIRFSSGGVSVRENWTFRIGAGISWTIHRDYLTGGTLDDSYFPGWDFTDVNTWTAGLLDTGGVAWSRYLGESCSYAAHAGSVVFWKGGDCLKIGVAAPDKSFAASRFTRQAGGILSFAQSLTAGPLVTKHALHRSIQGVDVWAPFQVAPGSLQTTLTLEAADANAVRNRGIFKGLDGAAIGDLLDTIGRYGVVDREIVGGNGWLTGYVCLHEPFFAQMGLALADSNYTANLASSLDAWRDHALMKDGRVKSRWHHDTSDNTVPGTYDPTTGYYECGWGYLLDSQTDYPINVAEQFDLSGDLKWLKAQKEPCERALDWLLARDSDHDGLVEMMTDSHTQGKSSDWIDIVWASWENALVNAKLYQALVLWSERESILGDSNKSERYRAAAAKLKESFVKPLDQGGFWDPEKGWFAYWRDKDGSIHGDNLVTPVNFCAVAYGLCDADQRQRILDGTEARMRQENLFHWPLCFLPFTAAEGGGGAFPTYENGDIFLSWGELAVRSYAAYDPAIAVAYVERILARYRQDGLSFQRYLRANQAGAGDDILAGNSMTIVGLYRNIYGVRPQWNRLILDPHLTPELTGTALNYKLRGQLYQLKPGIGTSSATVGGFTATAKTPFALSADPTHVKWFAGNSNTPSLVITRPTSAPIKLLIETWPSDPTEPRKWRESGSATPSRHTISGLLPHATYDLKKSGLHLSSLTADPSGTVTFQLSPPVLELADFSLEPLAN